MAVYSAVVPTSPTRTRPVFIPIRICSGVSPALAVRFSLTPTKVRSSACISRAVRIARSGSSSWAVGAPKSAITASPMCLSILPPWAVITVSRRVQSAFIIALTSSGSIVSTIAVKPEMSAKSTVTCLRCCAVPGCCACKAASFSRMGASAASTTASPRRARWASSASIACSSCPRSFTRSLHARRGAVVTHGGSKPPLLSQAQAPSQ